MCCDVELITRQTLTEFSRIRELTPLRGKQAESCQHSSKAKENIHMPTLMQPLTVLYLLI